MKDAILRHALPGYGGAVWMTPHFYDTPLAAYVEEVADFPCIETDGACFKLIENLRQKAHELGVLIQAGCVGYPLAAAYWFECVDQGLEYAEWENRYRWLLPEVPPYIERCVPVDAEMIRTTCNNYQSLQPQWRATLLRSMERFRQSQCRHETLDRVLDLALAFEIAMSDGGENAPLGWKVAVRSAQLIGGTLQVREQNRSTLEVLYKFRSHATHGSTLKGTKEVEKTLQESSQLYVHLMKTLLTTPRKPNWKDIELQSPAASGT
jgi:hypothetical protein